MSQPRAGTFLVARPKLLDPNFRKTVILLFRHDASQGSMGIVVNRATGVKVSDFVDKINAVAGRQDLLWNGGPCQPNAVWVLHRRGDLADAGEEVAPGCWLGGSPKLLETLVSGTVVNPAPSTFRVLRGYAGWAPGQLGREIEEGSWRVAESHGGVIFGAHSDPLWQDVLTRAQIPFELPPDAIRNASLN